MSERQQAILTTIREYIEHHGYPPTVREIGRGLGIQSSSVVDYHLNRLAEMGQIIRYPGISRGIHLPNVASVCIGEEIEAMDLDGRPIGRVLFAAPVSKAA